MLSRQLPQKSCRSFLSGTFEDCFEDTAERGGVLPHDMASSYRQAMVSTFPLKDGKCRALGVLDSSAQWTRDLHRNAANLIGEPFYRC